MADLAKIAIEIDSTGAKVGADQAVQSAERIKTSFTGMTTVSQAVTASVAKLSPAMQSLAHQYEQLRQQLRAGTITQQEYMLQQQKLLDQMVKTPPVLKETAAASQVAAKGYQAMGQAALQASQMQQQAAQASTVAAGGFGKLERPLQALAFSLAGIPGPLGRVIGSLGLLTIGSGLMIGISAGIAALSALWEAATAKSRKLKQETDELIASLTKLRAQEGGGKYKDDLDKLDARLASLREKADKEMRIKVVFDVQPLAGALTTAGPAVTIGGAVSAKTQKELIEAQQARNKLLQQEQDRVNDIVLARLAGDKRIADDAKRYADDQRRWAKERADQVRKVGEAELDAAIAVARVRGNLTAAQAAEVAKRLEAIEREAAAMDKLTAAERERLVLAKQLVVVLEATAHIIETTTTALAKAAAAGAATGPLARQRLISQTGGRQTVGGLDSTTRAQIDVELARIARENAEQQIKSLQEVRRASIAFAVGLGAISPQAGLALEAMSTLMARVKEFGINSKEAAQAIAGAAVALAGAVISGRTTAASAARGAIGGAAAGMLIGGPIGGVIGGVVGGIGGLLSGGARRREEIARLREAEEAFTSRTASPLANELAALAKEFNALYDEAKRLGQGTSELTREYLRQKAAIEERARTEQRQFNEELKIRQLQAQGLSESAAVAQAALEAERELADARAKGYDAATIAALQLTQAMEAQAAAADAAAEAAQRQAEANQKWFSREAVAQDVIARERRLAGDVPGAKRAEIAGEEVRKFAEAMDLLTRGVIDQTLYQRLLGVATQETAKSLDDLSKANKAFAQDLDVRFLEAMGQSAAAEDLRFQIAQARELAQAKEQGVSQEMLDRLIEIQKLEAAARERGGTGSQVADAATEAATRAVTAVQASVTERTAFQLVDLTRSELTVLQQIEVNTRGGRTAASGTAPGTVSLNIQVRLRADTPREMAEELGDEIERILNERLGRQFQTSQIFAGSVARG